jgi:DNA-binding NarL/FixJ family response regulator
MHSTDTAPLIIIADDHPLFRTALKDTLQRMLEPAAILEAGDFAALEQQLQQHGTRAHLLLLDLQMPGCDGFSALIYVTAHFPGLPVMIVSAHSEADVVSRALEHGACGFLPKSAPLDIMREALHTVLNGGLWQPAGQPPGRALSSSEQSIASAVASLTPQQFRVATMVNQGMLNKQIAFELHVTEATIKAHMTEIFRKLNVNSRTQVALALGQLAVRSGI